MRFSFTSIRFDQACDHFSGTSMWGFGNPARHGERCGYFLGGACDICDLLGGLAKEMYFILSLFISTYVMLVGKSEVKCQEILPGIVLGHIFFSASCPIPFVQLHILQHFHHQKSTNEMYCIKICAGFSLSYPSSN